MATTLINWFNILLFMFVVCSNGNYVLELTVQNTTINKLPLLFHGYMTDWLTSEPWTNGSMLEANLSNPQLIELTKALGPAIWRLGGSPQDNALYNISDNFCVTSIPKYSCSNPPPQTINCLNITRWKELNEFAKQTGSKILFGLNACYGRESSSTSMNFTNIQQLFQYTSSNAYSGDFNNLYGFEFGNELNNRIDANIYAKDFVFVSNLLNAYNWSGIGETPIMIGFDALQNGQSWVKNVYNELNHTTNGNLSSTLTLFTYHHYPQCVSPNGDISVYSMQCLSSIPNLASNYYDISTKSYNIPTLMGEGSDHSGGGVYNQTNKWIGSFYYMYQLCEVAKWGLQGTVRADLVGGNYELIDRFTFIPNPDYWILWLFKNYIGDIVYHAKLNTNNETYVRGYAFSSRLDIGGYICVLINFNLKDVATVRVNIEGIDMNGYMFGEYYIEGVGSDGLHTNVISVNDVIMEYKDGEFPKLTAKPCNGTVVLQPHTMALITVSKQK